MIPRLADMRHVSGYRLWLRFEDGREGEVDLEAELWGEVFEPLTQKDLFKTVELDREAEYDMLAQRGRTSLRSFCTTA